MPRKTIQHVKLAGFAAESAQPGDKVKLTVKDWATSDSSMFYVYADPLGQTFFGEVPGFPAPRDVLRYYLAVIHGDDSADVYWDDFKVIAYTKVNRPIAAGEIIHTDDMAELAEVRFPDIEIKASDRVVYLGRSGWRFGIFFDLTMKIDGEVLAKELAVLQSELLLGDILGRTLGHLRDKARSPDAGDAFIICEGKTDYLHLEKAFEQLGYRRRFGRSSEHPDLGDIALLRLCQDAAHLPRHRIPVVCVFDRDNPRIQQELVKRSGGTETAFQSWGSNVYSMMLPVPPGRERYKNISIELYYPDDVLARTTEEGKRLVFDKELKKEISPDGKIQMVLVPLDPALELEKKVYSTDVDNVRHSSGRNVAISKTCSPRWCVVKCRPFPGLLSSLFAPLHM